MERVQQFISQQNIWMRALLLTLAISLALFIVGLLMGKLRHLVIEGALRQMLGAKAANCRHRHDDTLLLCDHQYHPAHGAFQRGSEDTSARSSADAAAPLFGNGSGFIDPKIGLRWEGATMISD